MEQIFPKRKLAIVSDERSLKERRVMFSDQTLGSSDGCVSSLEDASDASDDDFFLSSGLNSDEGRFSDFAGEDEDIDSCFDFLNSKQRILTRVSEVLCHEETFTASSAMKSSKQISFPSSELMKEARSILWTLGLRANALEPHILPTLSPKYLARSKKSPRHPAIDVSYCEHLTAHVWRSRQKAVTSSQHRGTNTLLNLPRSIFCEGQWMAQALVGSAPSMQQPKETDQGDQFLWKVISNPMTQSLGLLPPTGISMENAIDIEEAVAISVEARLVSQSTPPFCVVYANKAFLELSGIQSKDSIIGRPVETIIHVPDPSDICAESTAPDTVRFSARKSLRGRLCFGKDDVCKVSVTPVVDQNRKHETRNLDTTITKSIAQNSGKYSCMSHILIEMY